MTRVHTRLLDMNVERSCRPVVKAFIAPRLVRMIWPGLVEVVDHPRDYPLNCVPVKELGTRSGAVRGANQCRDRLPGARSDLRSLRDHRTLTEADHAKA